MAAPVLFLDVDWVIAPAGSPSPASGPVRWADLPPGHMHFPVEILERLMRLHDRGAVRVEWLTSWQEEAATHLAPALGLPSWPAWTRGAAPRREGMFALTDWWKERVVLSALTAGQRVIWCDDDIAYRARFATPRNYPNTLLVFSPSSGTGLTTADFTELDRWLAHPDSQ